MAAVLPSGTAVMRIGIDFDNTLIDYDQVFTAGGKRRGLIDAGLDGSQRGVRDSIRLLHAGEFAWQLLQAYVYSTATGSATMFDGADVFLRKCRAKGFDVFVISHKTQ